LNIKDPGSTSLVGRLYVQVITNSKKRSVFTNGLDFMDLIIMRFKLSEKSYFTVFSRGI